MKSSLILAILAMLPFAVEAQSAPTVDRGQDPKEMLTEWRYLAVDDVNAPLPQGDRARLAVVTLPWQLEAVRPMAFWLRKVEFPQRFKGHDIWLEVSTNAPTRIFVNGAQVAEGKGGLLRALLAKAGDATQTVDLAVACTFTEKNATRFEEAALITDTTGLLAAVDRFETVLKTFASFSRDVSNEPWAYCLKAPDDAARPDFDDSKWERGTTEFKWYETDTHCWFRARLTVPRQIAGFATQGKQLGLRAKFNDHGRLFVNGQELMSDANKSYLVPNDVQPGQDVVIAARVLNDKGKGQMENVQWRLIELDASEKQLASVDEQFHKLARVIGLHDHPEPEWTSKLDEMGGCLKPEDQSIDGLAQALTHTQQRLDQLTTAMAVSPIIVVPPYLQDVRQDSITVMWETSAPTPAHVEYGTDKLDKDAVEPQNVDTIHRVVLSGLQPGSTYRYRVVSGNQVTDTLEFRTAPNVSSPFAFLVWGDNQTTPTTSERVCAQMAKTQADFVVSVGDVVECGGHWWQWAEQYLLPIHAWAGWRPSFVAIGNHEYDGDDDPALGVAAFEKYFTHPYAAGQAHTNYWYSFDYANAHFICLDSMAFQETRSAQSMRIPEENPQLVWLKQDLEKTRPADWTFVFVHKPPRSECWAGGYYDGEAHFRTDLVPLFEQAGVDIVFSGHMHGYERGLPHPPYDPATGKGNNAAYIITGGGAGKLDNHKYKEWEQTDLPDHPASADTNDPDAGRFYKYHFCRVQIDGKRLDFEAREVLPDGQDGGVFDRFTLQK